MHHQLPLDVTLSKTTLVRKLSLLYLLDFEELCSDVLWKRITAKYCLFFRHDEGCLEISWLMMGYIPSFYSNTHFIQIFLASTNLLNDIFRDFLRVAVYIFKINYLQLIYIFNFISNCTLKNF
ncbi:UNVERIFIED_CONTAM: hypothetical protein RMT77_018042 [Armadillidium vulgare]